MLGEGVETMTLEDDILERESGVFVVVVPVLGEDDVLLTEGGQQEVLFGRPVLPF